MYTRVGVLHSILSSAGFFHLSSHKNTIVGKPSHLTPSSHLPTEQAACVSAQKTLLQVSQNRGYMRILQKSLVCRGCEVTSRFKYKRESPQSQLLALMQLIKKTVKPSLLYWFCVFLSQGLWSTHQPGKPRLVSQPLPFLALIRASQVCTKETSLTSLLYRISDGSQGPLLIYLND